MNHLILKLEKELKLRNFSPKTLKSYMHETEKFLIYAKDSLNKETLENYILRKLEKQNPSTVAHSISILTFFFEKVLNQNNMVVPNLKKQKSRKWVRYELPNPNDLWHTDWSYDPFSGKQLTMFIDDKTRLVTSVGIFDRATAENTIALLYEGIAKYGKPFAIMTDHGAQYYGQC